MPNYLYNNQLKSSKPLITKMPLHASFSYLEKLGSGSGPPMVKIEEPINSQFQNKRSGPPTF
jgi:hypothetical protein